MNVMDFKSISFQRPTNRFTIIDFKFILKSFDPNVCVHLSMFATLSSCFQDFTVKLSDFGLAKDGPQGDDTHVSTRVMGTQGYAAPEYIMTGNN